MRIYRGVDVHPDHVRGLSFGQAHHLGRHWTTNYQSALRFATAGIHLPYLEPHGTVIEATTSPRNIIVPGTQEWKDLGGGADGGIFYPDHEEQESTIRHGSNVSVEALHHYVPGKNGPRLLRTIYL